MNIYQRINQVMKDCGAVAKSSYNPQQKYKYRGIDAVMNALNPAMSKNGVFVVPEVLDITREERESKTGSTLVFSTVKVKYTIYAEDGSSVTSVVIGEGMDSGDKSINKAMSAAFKYACFQVFCIPTDEMIDSETDSPEVKKTPGKEKGSASKNIESQNIGELKAKALAEFLTRNEIAPEYIVNSCKVNSLQEISEGRHAWILKNMEQLKNGYNAWKQKQAS